MAFRKTRDAERARRFLGTWALGMPTRRRGARKALSLRDARRDPIASRALDELMHEYAIAEEGSGLVLTKKSGELTLFLHDLDDLHQWDFVHHKERVKQLERLNAQLTKIKQQREGWKVHALMAEAQLLEAASKTGTSDGRHNAGDVRYVSLKRYLAKRFHPDFAPGQGLEKIVRNEIFKEIWSEVDRIDQGGAAFAPKRSPAR